MTLEPDDLFGGAGGGVLDEASRPMPAGLLPGQPDGVEAGAGVTPSCWPMAPVRVAGFGDVDSRRLRHRR